MKIFLPFIILFTILSQGHFSNGLLAMDRPENNRRLVKYSTSENYISSFQEGEINHGKPKILFIGAGLAYDDLVPNSQAQFIPIGSKLKCPALPRTKYYPYNAYLIDLDGKFFYKEDANSESDLQADIRKDVGSAQGLPSEFKGKFDFIVLEYLNFNAMTRGSIKNIYSLLKIGGKIIDFSKFNVVIRDIIDINKDIETEQNYLSEEHIHDQDNNILNCIFYSCDRSNGNISLLEKDRYHDYIVSPIYNQKSDIYKGSECPHEECPQRKNNISFQDLKKKYTKETDYKQFINDRVKNIYEKNVTHYFKNLIPDAKLSFGNEDAIWCGVTPKQLSTFPTFNFINRHGLKLLDGDPSQEGNDVKPGKLGVFCGDKNLYCKVSGKEKLLIGSGDGSLPEESTERFLRTLREQERLKRFINPTFQGGDDQQHNLATNQYNNNTVYINESDVENLIQLTSTLHYYTRQEREEVLVAILYGYLVISKE